MEEILIIANRKDNFREYADRIQNSCTWIYRNEQIRRRNGDKGIVLIGSTAKYMPDFDVIFKMCISKGYRIIDMCTVV